MLDLLVRKNLLLFPLDPDRGWFRYHPLFASFLRRCLDERYPGLPAALSQRSADWFAGHVPPPSVVTYYEKEPDPGAHLPVAPPDGPMTDPSRQLPRLSQREQEVLALIEAGLTYRQVADKLVVSMGTVQTHVKHLYIKLGAHSAPEAVSRARQLGLLR
jgi:ATP/maltotriose-dependent transcriptional regulator MalT